MPGSYVRLDPALFEDPKIEGISNDALALWLAGLCYCNRRLGTSEVAAQGLLPPSALRRITVDAHLSEAARDPVVQELLDAHLWQIVESGGYQIVNYAKYQKSREQWEVELSRRDSAAERAERGREQNRLRQQRWYEAHKDEPPLPPDCEPNGTPNGTSTVWPNKLPPLTKRPPRQPSMLDLEELRSRRVAG